MEFKGMSIPLSYLHIDFESRSLTFGGDGLAVKLSLPLVRRSYEPRKVLLEVLTGEDAPKFLPEPVVFTAQRRRGPKSNLLRT